jgi:trimeric autotransporter adhesin
MKNIYKCLIISLLSFEGLAQSQTIQDNSQSVTILPSSLATKRNSINTTNTALGAGALSTNSSQPNMTALGYQALQNISTGQNNTAIGAFSLQNGTTNQDMTAVGVRAARTSAGNASVILGYEAGLNAGDLSTYVGFKAGQNATGNYNVLIGSFAGQNEVNINNKLYIDNTATSNPLIWGDFDVDALKINGNLEIRDGIKDKLGIGVALPQRNLHVHDASTGSYASFTNSFTTNNINRGLLVGVANASHDGYLWNYESGNLLFGTSNSERMRLNSNGNLGIGLTNPARRLHLHDDFLLISNASSGVNNSDGLQFGLSASDAQIVNKENGNLILSTNDSEKMRIQSDGRVGIGLASPNSLLQIHNTGGGFLRSNAQFTNSSSGNSVSDGLFVGLGDPSGIVQGGYVWNYENQPLVFGTNSLTRMTIAEDGNVSIGTPSTSNKFHVVGTSFFDGNINVVNGDINCNGNFLCPSDLRFKKNFTKINNPLANLLKINGLYYDYDNEKFPERHFSQKRQLGVIAQEVEKLYPELVQTDANGYKSVDYVKLTPILIEAIKELNAKVETLEKDKKDFTTRLQKIEMLLTAQNKDNSTTNTK